MSEEHGTESVKTQQSFENQKRKQSMERISIAEKDLYCIAKILQSSIYTRNQFSGCRFCRYNCDEESGNETQKITKVAGNYDRMICRLQDITGVDFSYQMDDPPERIKKDKSRCGDSDF